MSNHPAKAAEPVSDERRRKSADGYRTALCSLSYQPSPFCILDEIDAPLDDANIQRFADFLRDYAGNTQFIVITHRKGTMECADIMYGVTMEESGVSKLLSVKINAKENE